MIKIKIVIEIQTDGVPDALGISAGAHTVIDYLSRLTASKHVKEFIVSHASQQLIETKTPD